MEMIQQRNGQKSAYKTVTRRAGLAASLVLVMLSSCTRKEQERPGPASVIKIGAVLARSGPASEIGEPEAKTLEMLVADINADPNWSGPKLDLLPILDSGGEPARAKTHVEALITSKSVAVIIGPSTSGESLAACPLAAEYKVPMISLAASHKIIEVCPEWAFKTAQSDSLAVKTVATDLQRRNISKIAVFHSDDQFGQSGAEQWQSLALGFGLTIENVGSFAREDTNLSTPIVKLLGVSPQALIIWGTGPGPAEATRAARANKFSGPIYQSHGSASQKFLELAGDAANGVRLPASKILALNLLPSDDPQRPQLLKFAETFRKAHPSLEPSHFGGHAWDALQLVKLAVQSGAHSSEEIRSALERTTNYAGITGVFQLSSSDHEGLTMHSFALLEVTDGHWDLVAP